MKRFLSPLLLFASIPAFGALSFSGTTLAVVEVTPEASTGLEMIYVLDHTSGVRVTSSFAGGSWQSFGSMGGAYAEDLPAPGGSVTLNAGDTGIIVKGSDGRQHCYYIVDYSAHALELRSLAPVPDQGDCARTALALDGSAEAIPYYTINGRRVELSRELKIEYSSQEFDEESYSYRPTTVETTLEGAGAVFGVDSPLCDTNFTLSGDRFLRRWGREVSVVSDTYRTNAIAAETRATPEVRENDNEQKEDAASGLGGSAPCTIEFEAAVSDGVVFKEWQISTSPEFDIADNSFNEERFSYTFTENGTSYVRFVANNAVGSCEYVGTVYEVFIGESRLEIPNAFSPGASPGVNDEWKVSYKSLVEFECHIFNRWGVKMCSFTDPALGWDGKYGGKLVPAGTYYYVIKARGSDGVEYKKSGDINIINYRNDSPSGSEGGENPAP